MRGDLVRCTITVLAIVGAAVGGIVVSPGTPTPNPANEHVAMVAPVASAYQAVHIRITGLPPGTR